MAESRTGIFLCYRRQDSEDFASRIFDELARHFGREHIFKDVDSLLPGLDWQEHLDARLAQAAVAIVIIGDEWVDCRGPDGRRRLENEDDHVCHEISRVLGEKIPVVPLLIGATPMPESSQLPEAIRGLVRRQNFAVRRDQHFRNDVRLLIENLERLPGLASPVEMEEPAATAPVIAPREILKIVEQPMEPPKVAPAPRVETPLAARHSDEGAPPMQVAEVMPREGRLNGFGFFIGWMMGVILLPVPGLGVWVQQQLLRARGLPAVGWLRQTGWAAPAGYWVMILVCMHLTKGFGRPELRYYGRPSEQSGYNLYAWRASIPEDPGKTDRNSWDSSVEIEPAVGAGQYDRFCFGALAAAPLFALLGLQWSLLRPVLRQSWLWFLPVPVLLITASMSGIALSDVAGIVGYVYMLHPMYQGFLLSLLLRAKGNVG